MLNQLQGVFLSLHEHEDLINSKRAAGRDQDLEDVRLLELGDEAEA
jgi:hypothetical protein